MRAIHLQNGVVSVCEAKNPIRTEGCALLRFLLGGVCNTDLELQKGYYGFSGTPGHEFVAEVVESDRAELVGKRVVGEINVACTECAWCRKGMGRHCPKRTVLGIVNQPGAFSEYFVLPDRNLHVLPDWLPSERAVFTEPLAAACAILEQVTIPPGETIAVLGDGKLGLLVAQVLAAHGYPVRLFGDLHGGRSCCIAAAAGGGRLTDGLCQRRPRAAFEWVVDATGNPEGLRAAVAMTKPRGTVILKSTVRRWGHCRWTAGVPVMPSTRLRSSGSRRCGRFEATLPLIEHELILLEEMIARRDSR